MAVRVRGDSRAAKTKHIPFNSKNPRLSKGKNGDQRDVGKKREETRQKTAR
jgi:hypothetical protein